MPFFQPKQFATAALMTGAALGLSSHAHAVPFAEDGNFATFTVGFSNFETDTDGMQVGDTWDITAGSIAGLIAVVGGGEYEFEALNGSQPSTNRSQLFFITGLDNAGFEFYIDFARAGIIDPVGPPGSETGTLTFTIDQTTTAFVSPLGDSEALNAFQLAGIGSVTTPDAPYMSPQPFSYIASGTIANNSQNFSGSFSFSSPPDAAVTSVSEPATLILFGAGLLGMGFISRRRWSSQDLDA